MQLQNASRKKAKIKLGIQSPSGGGKTMSALLIAYGLCGNWNKIAVIDTENNSADECIQTKNHPQSKFEVMFKHNFKLHSDVTSKLFLNKIRKKIRLEAQNSK